VCVCVVCVWVCVVCVVCVCVCVWCGVCVCWCVCVCDVCVCGVGVGVCVVCVGGGLCVWCVCVGVCVVCCVCLWCVCGCLCVCVCVCVCLASHHTVRFCKCRHLNALLTVTGLDVVWCGRYGNWICFRKRQVKVSAWTPWRQMGYWRCSYAPFNLGTRWRWINFKFRLL